MAARDRLPRRRDRAHLPVGAASSPARVVVAVVRSGGPGRAPRAGVSGAQRVLRVGLDVRDDLRAARWDRRAGVLGVLLVLALLFGAALRRSSRPFGPAPRRHGAQGDRVRAGAHATVPACDPGMTTLSPGRPAEGNVTGERHRLAAEDARGHHRRPGHRGKRRRDPPNGDRIFSAMPSKRSAGAAHHRLDVRVLAGEIGAAFAEALADRARAGTRAGPARRLGVPLDPHPAHPDGRGRRPHPVVPSAHASAGAQGQPPYPPEGADRRRSGRVHRRGRHRRRMEGRRAQRTRVARHALPPSRTGGGRPSGRIPRQLARDGRRPVRGIGRPLPRPTAGRFEPRPVRPRRIGARLERHLDAVPGVAAARAGADPDRDSVLRPRHAAERTASSRPRSAA